MRCGFLRRDLRFQFSFHWAYRALLLFCAIAVLSDAGRCEPIVSGDTLRVETALPQIQNVQPSFALDGRAVAAKNDGGQTLLDISALGLGRHILTLTIPDKEFPSRRHVAPLSFLKVDAPGARNSHLVIGPDILAWRIKRDGEAAPPMVWDAIGNSPARLTAIATDPDGIEARVEFLSAGRPSEKTTAKAGKNALKVRVNFLNRARVAQRILASELRFLSGAQDLTARFFALPISPLPSVLAPGAKTTQTFRVDTFSDTPIGAYRVEANAVCIPASENLLDNGDFEAWRLDDGKEPGTQAWLAEEGTVPNSQREWLRAGDSPEQLADEISFGLEYSSARSNAERIVTQGENLLHLSQPVAPPAQRQMPGALAHQSVRNVRPGERYLAGIDSWGGSRFQVTFSDAEDKPLAGQERNFSGFYWRDDVANWRTRTMTLQAPPGASSARFSLLANTTESTWDNGFFVPVSALKRADNAAAATLNIEAQNGQAAVFYEGEDRQTQGDWIGKYGNHAFILCAMSSPRDMVGGQIKPVKIDHRNPARVFANETIRVRGEGEMRYDSWTGNPRDFLTRHWIGALRTDEKRVLENPLWGHRTYAMWDDLGEDHPSDARGPDVWVRLPLPPGAWRVSFYFLDRAWADSPTPRAHRLAFYDQNEKEIGNARVSDFGQGVYKVFRAQGGRDLTLRIRKDFSASVSLSGIFLDPITLPIDLPPGVGAHQAAREKWRAAFGKVGGFDEEAAALNEYSRALIASGPTEAVAKLQETGDKWFEAGEYWRAGLILDAADTGSTPDAPLDVSGRAEKRALQFRTVFPRRALEKLRESLAALEKLPAQERLALSRALAARVFDVAIEDHTESKGMGRLPMLLAQEAYGALEKQVEYSGLTAGERAKKLAIAERQTWYLAGWNEVVAEAQRFWPSLTTEQRKKLGPKWFGNHIVHPLGMVAQNDVAALAQAEKAVRDFIEAQSDDVASGFAMHSLAAIYFQQGRRAQALALCEEVIKNWPGTHSAKLSTSLAVKIQQLAKQKGDAK